MINVTDRLSIPEEELRFTASRSSGPGGQHVNKVASRVTLWFDVAHSPSLDDEQKSLIMNRLSSRVNKEGVLWVASQESRSQIANREAAVERFVGLLRSALKRRPVRKRRGIPAASKQRRLEEKKRRARVKQRRVKKNSWDE